MLPLIRKGEIQALLPPKIQAGRVFPVVINMSHSDLSILLTIRRIFCRSAASEGRRSSTLSPLPESIAGEGLASPLISPPLSKPNDTWFYVEQLYVTGSTMHPMEYQAALTQEISRLSAEVDAVLNIHLAERGLKAQQLVSSAKLPEVSDPETVYYTLSLLLLEANLHASATPPNLELLCSLETDLPKIFYSTAEPAWDDKYSLSDQHEILKFNKPLGCYYVSKAFNLNDIRKILHFSSALYRFRLHSTGSTGSFKSLNETDSCDCSASTESPREISPLTLLACPDEAPNHGAGATACPDEACSDSALPPQPTAVKAHAFALSKPKELGALAKLMGLGFSTSRIGRPICSKEPLSIRESVDPLL